VLGHICVAWRNLMMAGDEAIWGKIDVCSDVVMSRGLQSSSLVSTCKDTVLMQGFGRPEGELLIKLSVRAVTDQVNPPSTCLFKEETSWKLEKEIAEYLEEQRLIWASSSARSHLNTDVCGSVLECFGLAKAASGGLTGRQQVSSWILAKTLVGVLLGIAFFTYHIPCDLYISALSVKCSVWVVH